MTAAERKQAIADFIKNTKPAMTGIKIMYHGERTPFEAYNIPLDLLVYNPFLIAILIRYLLSLILTWIRI